MDQKNILDALHDYFEESIFVTDGEGKILFSNETASHRLGTTSEELEGRNIRELLEEGLYERSTVLEAIRTKETVVGSLYKNPQQAVFSNSVPVLGPDGEVELVVTNNMSPEQNMHWEEIIRNHNRENERLRRKLDYLQLQDQRVIVAESPAMQNVLRTIDAVAPTESSVVILGKSGTGKDLIAQLIHEKSSRKDQSFIGINCAAMPENLLESELFGYEGGAFTGARQGGKIGLFEATTGGTLFLDEVGEMSLALQSKLLRVLENKEIRRIGGVETIPIDVRMICATNSNLEQMVQDGAFREDLYYRLSVFTLNLPPLKDRKEDIIPIAERFLGELNRKYGTNKRLSSVAMRSMMDYSWPGNIRELRNVIERTYVVSPGEELMFAPVPMAVPDESHGAFQGPHEQIEFASLKEFVNYAEDKYIRKIMDECGGSVNQTAQRLGIHRSVLYRKLHRDK